MQTENDLTDQELRDVMLDRVREVPQFNKMESHKIEAWVDRVIAIERDRALWHVARLSGFGGSDMGPLHNSLTGGNNAFTNAFNIVSGKLAILPPSKGDKHTRRGHKMEPFIEALFESKLTSMGVNFERLDELRTSKIESGKNTKFPWMRSSLDRLYDIDGKRVIVDYKGPSVDVMETYHSMLDKVRSAFDQEPGNITSIPPTSERELAGAPVDLEIDDYIFQLHHYFIDAQTKGVEIDEMWLAVFDYKNGADVVLMKIEVDDLVIANLIEAGEHYWNNHVLEGVLPDFDAKKVVDAADLDPDVLQISDKMVALHHAEKSLKDFNATVKSDILEIVASHGALDGQTLTIGAAEVKPDLVLDEDYAAERLSEHGFSEADIDMLRKSGSYDTTKIKALWSDFTMTFDGFMEGIKTGDKQGITDSVKSFRDLKEKLPQKEKGKFDHKKLKEALLSCGEDYNLFFIEEMKIGVTRKKSPENDIIKDRVNENLREMVQFLASEPQHENTNTI